MNIIPQNYTTANPSFSRAQHDFTKQQFDKFLSLAIQEGNLENVRFALSNFANPKGLEEDGSWSYLHSAVFKGNIGIVKLLIAYGANVDTLTVVGQKEAPIHIACCQDDPQILELLIAHHADLTLPGFLWKTPLELAIQHEKIPCVKALLEAGANVNHLNIAYGSSPLNEACEQGNLEVIALLLERGANPNPALRTSPLHLAANNPAALELLLSKGANVNSISTDDNYREGCTPLHDAYRYHNQASIDLLLAANADPTIRNAQGQTPAEVGESFKHAIKA